MAADGRGQMNDFWAIIQNPRLWVQFPHTITAAIATGAFFIAGVSASKCRKGQETVQCSKNGSEFSTLLEQLQLHSVLFFGHAQAQNLIKTHPMKVAAAEDIMEYE